MSTIAELFFIAFLLIGVISVASIPFIMVSALDDDSPDDDVFADELEQDRSSD